MRLFNRSILSIFFVLFAHTALAQEGKYKEQMSIAGIKYTKYIASASLLADVEFLKPETVSYGLELNTHVRFFSKPKLRKGSSEYNPKIAERELFVKPGFGFIYRRHYHTAFYFVPTLAYRGTSPKGFYTELNLDAGYYFAKLNDPVYQMQPDGTMAETKGGYSNLMLGGKFLLGFDLSKKFDIPLGFHAGAALFYRYPNNQQWVRHITVHAGISYIFRRAKE